MVASRRGRCDRLQHYFGNTVIHGRWRNRRNYGNRITRSTPKVVTSTKGFYSRTLEWMTTNRNNACLQMTANPSKSLSVLFQLHPIFSACLVCKSQTPHGQLKLSHYRWTKLCQPRRPTSIILISQARPYQPSSAKPILFFSRSSVSMFTEVYSMYFCVKPKLLVITSSKS